VLNDQHSTPDFGSEGQTAVLSFAHFQALIFSNDPPQRQLSFFFDFQVLLFDVANLNLDDEVQLVFFETPFLFLEARHVY
jgi:hypothetical protein